MLYTVQNFCHYVESDLNALIEEIAGISRNVSDEEKKAYRASYPVVASMLAKAMKKNPSLGDVNISTMDMALEYKLPAASAWCDLVLLGDGKNHKQQVVVIELKNYQKNNTDAPGGYEGLMRHKGETIKHPADQVKGYTEYCRRFHSVVRLYDAEVNGCVYFTQPIDLQPYQAVPNKQLTTEYPLYNTESTDALSDFICSKISKGNEPFAAEFINGFYEQDRNILHQVAQNLQAKNKTARPFVLLDEQRLGFNLVMQSLQERVADGQKEVIIVEGPPGSGKSAVAVNVWIEAALKYSQSDKYGNVVFVTTSSSQKDNWGELFNDYGKQYHASDLILSANNFNPGLNGQKMKDVLLPIMRRKDTKYVSETNDNSLKFEYYEDYVECMIKHNMTSNYKDNLHFLSVVDEAHALINPAKEGFCSNKTAGWCFQMGPQAYHIIRESQISVFFTDGKQSFRDNETTSIDDLKTFAQKLGAKITVLSLEGMQFRCAGSVDYVNWVEHLFSNHPIKNADLWKDKFNVEIVDYPSEMENRLRSQMANGDYSCRILSSYTRKWVSGKDLTADHNGNAAFDFDLEDKNGQRWQKYWNNPLGYQIFVQGTRNSEMHSNPLSEVGCPYVVRGFDYNHIGLLWLEDIFYRNGHWFLSINNMQETANGSTRSKAKEEQKQAIRNHIVQGRMNQIDVIPSDDNRFPAAKALFAVTAQAYRILMTRAVKSLTIYIKDPETREYVRSLLK